MIRYTSDLAGVRAEDLTGFFEGWPAPPTPATLLRILEGSTACVLALDHGEGSEERGGTSARPAVVGLVTAISDGVLAASIPLLEVRSPWRGRGIGSGLVRAILEQVGDLYMIDLVCDEDVRPFYERLGFLPARAMVRRAYGSQSGVPEPPV